MKRSWLAIGLAAGALHASAQPQGPMPTPPLGERQALFATSLFGRACVGTAGDPRQVEAAAGKLGLKPMARDEAVRFVGRQGGTAWALEVQGGQFVVSVRSDRVCTVYARRVDADALLREAVAMLPAATGGFEVVKEDSLVASSASNISTFLVRRDGKLFATWIVNTSTLPDAFYQGALSLKMSR